MSYYCNDCGVYVTYGNEYQHEQGWKHQQNANDRSPSEDYESSSEFEDDDYAMDGGTVYLFHGTNRQAAKEIERSGQFLLGESGQFGGAIYFASTIKAARRRSQSGDEVVFRCLVKLGQTMILHEEASHMNAHRARQQYACQSLALETANGTTYAVYHSNKVQSFDRV